MTESAKELLERARTGDSSAAASLLPLVYAELRRIADGYLRRERVNHTLQPTALVHEAYVKLVRGSKDDFGDHAQFLAVAANAMRQILVDHARARHTAKRSGPVGRETIAGFDKNGDRGIDLLDLEAALTTFAASHPRPARVAELRLFAGLDPNEIAGVLSVSVRTISNDWSFARAWLRRKLDRDAAP